MESTNKTLENTLQLTFLGLLSFSFIGYFALQDKWIGFVFAHLAAISIMGFYGCLSAAIAQRKGYSYKKIFLIGFFIPLILGVISAFILAPHIEGSLPLTCGGWIVLGAGIITIIVSLLIRKKK